MFSSETKSADYSGFWFFLSTFFYGAFIAVLAVSMHPNEQNKFCYLVRFYFRCLDFNFGRGVFIFYLAMQMCEVSANGETWFAITPCVIAIIDMYLGFSVFKQTFIAASGEADGNQAQGEDVGERAPDAQYNNVGQADVSSRGADVVLETDQSTELSGQP